MSDETRAAMLVRAYGLACRGKWVHICRDGPSVYMIRADDIVSLQQAAAGAGADVFISELQKEAGDD